MVTYIASENKFDRVCHKGFPAMSGNKICAVMRSSRVTIRQMAQVNSLTMKRIRELRRNGVAAGGAAWEIYKMVEDARLTVCLNNRILKKVKKEQRAQ